MDFERHSLNFGLHRAALDGDDEAVCRALSEGADINTLDAAGRTTIMCAVAGEHWQNMDAYDASCLTPSRLNAIKVLLTHPDISLLTLNMPQLSMNGVIPLGMAAWLNQPDVVRVLLEDGADAVSVDGMDSHGATALMYAARDGSLEVVQLLLSHGARPDFRDRNHRASVQFSLRHPQILWLCETILRRHRWHESKSADRTRLSPGSEHLVELATSSMPFSDDLEPPPLSIFTQEATTRLTATLVSSIRASDLAFIHSLLFSPSIPTSSPSDLYPMSAPVLVNLLDSNGWGLIHHCAATEEPSLVILDALYCAGADVSLFTLYEQQTALHILAHYACTSTINPDQTHSFCDFALHLIEDLRAPLAARDQNDETCIHIAAEHGNSVDLLILFIACDTTGAIREFKNSRGMTALDVAKSEYRHLFGNGDMRPTSALSNRTVRPVESFSSLASVYIGSQNDSLSICSTGHFDIDGTIHQLLTTLRVTSPSVHHRKNSEHIKYLKTSLAETMDQCNRITQHFRDRINEATRIVNDLQKNADRIDTMRDVVVVATKGKLILRSISPKKRHRDSEDSQLTVVSLVGSRSQTSSSDYTSCHTSMAIQTALIDHLLTHRPIPSPTPTWLERLIQSPDSTTCKNSLREVEWELEELQKKDYTIASPPKLTTKCKQLVQKKRMLEEKIRDLQLEAKAEGKGSLSGASRLKAWLRRMVVPAHSPRKLEIVLDIDEKNCNVDREVKRLQSPPATTTYGDAIDASVDGALKTSQVVLEAVQRDLQSIKKSLAAAEEFIDMANHSVSRVHRVVKRAIKKRQTMIADLHASLKQDTTVGSSQHSLSPTHHSCGASAIIIPSRPSLASITTTYSNRSSVISVAATLTDHDDEDTRIIRRILLRKFEAQISGIWDEVDNVTGWLQIVKEAVRGVKRRAYL